MVGVVRAFADWYVPTVLFWRLRFVNTKKPHKLLSEVYPNMSCFFERISPGAVKYKWLELTLRAELELYVIWLLRLSLAQLKLYFI